MNIQFNYLYRDAGNYKNFGFAVFANPQQIPLATIEENIKKSLIDGEWFYVDKWSLPDLHKFPWDNELDHTFHEFQNVELTTIPATDARTIIELLAQIATTL